MAHVFIVSDETFSPHLRYCFAGTGAKDHSCDFITNNRIKVYSGTERLLVGMTADISRIRKGDSVLFYLQQSKQHEGMFFGVFKVGSDPFIADDDYLFDKLGKKLTFRVLLEPFEVYQFGATERECLDSLDGISHPSEMCWSLIYRKLKGNRGCTAITDREFDYLMKKIRQKNESTSLAGSAYDYDTEACKIVAVDAVRNYEGAKCPINITNRLLLKAKKRNAYEVHLQAHILQNLEDIKCLHAVDAPIIWIGNEVSCGVGMQSIDIMFVQETDDEVHLVVCELKDEQPVNYIQKQLKKYVNWIKDYILPAYEKRVIIHPTIVAPMPTNRTKATLSPLLENQISQDCVRTRYIGFDFDDTTLNFQEIAF